MIPLLVSLFINTLFVLMIAFLLPGVTVSGWGSACLVALFLSFLLVFLTPTLLFFTLPLTPVASGFFVFFVMSVSVWLAGLIIPGFRVHHFGYAMAFAALLAAFHAILNYFPLIV